VNGIDSTAHRRTTALGAATGFGLALVVSCGILLQRVLGSTAANAIAANTVTTLVAVAAVLATVRTYLTSFDPATFDPSVPPHAAVGPSVPPHAAVGPSVPPHAAVGPSVPPHAAVGPSVPPHAAVGPQAHSRRVTSLVTSQAIGALVGVLVIHALVWRGLDAHPWLREHPRQLVNDLVAVFGVLAFVWGCAQKPIRPQLMIAGLVLVLGYELTAGYWHIDAPVPVTQELAWSVQRFVGSEVTASGVGVLAFRLLLA